MTSRDAVITTLRNEITKVGLTDTSEKTLKVAVLAGVTKQIILGKSKFQVVEWMNKQRRQTGQDMWYIYDDVYAHIRDVDF